ncbi:hypothetical protein DL96DRAFT_1559732 [Flagelloscypha sp. PMI_526]|nr:hypothetical protein DL96DRAFT_1559732 [Flagelloscypha sp. PMI_526]
MPTIDVQPPLNDEYIAEVKDCAGVVYPHGFLDRTRCIEPFSGLSDTLAAPAEPIRVINTQDFASLHAEHLLSHAPDSVLFPFLHGIEGDNIAQNTFFRNSAGHRKLSVNSEGRFVAAVPKYRGLLWVLCDEDLADAPRHHREQVTALLARNRSAGSFSEEDSDEDMTYSDDEFDTEEDEDMPQSALSDTASAMALDIDVHQDSEGFQDMEVNSKDKDTPSHMHPVAHRLGLQTDSLANGIHSPDEMSATSTMPDLDTSLDPSSPTDSVPATPDADIAPIASCSPKRRQFGESKSQNPPPPVLTGTFLPSDIIRCSGEKDYEWEFLPLRVPDGISLRNFGIQVEKLARRIEVAQRKQRTERAKRLGLDLTSPHSGMYDGVVNDMDVEHSSLMVLLPPFALKSLISLSKCVLVRASALRRLRALPIQIPTLSRPQRREEHDHGNTVDFAEGSPLSPYPDNLPGDGLGYDICIECHEGVANFPTPAQMRAAEEHLGRLEAMWVDHCVAGREREYGAKSEDKGDGDGFWTVPPRPPPNADNVIHIPFPSSPPSTVAGCKSMIDVLRWIERWLRPVKSVRIPLPEPDNSEEDIVVGPSDPTSSPGHARRWSAVSSLFPSFINGTPQQASRARSFTSPDPPPVGLQHNRPSPSHHPRFSSPTRPIKLLLYSSDGYTESSIPALTLLMCAKKLSLPEAYLELQVEKRRSFFVFGSEVSGLRGLESLIKNGEQQQQRQAPIRATGMGRPAAKSISFAQPVPTPPKTAPPIEDPANSPTPTISEVTTPVPTPTPYRRPRATTSPATMFGMNHQAWFDDPRFDGSFRVGYCHFYTLGTSSLYLEEKEGRIKVLDIKGIAYVMKHLNLPLVDSYLVVRSRRLSVLIQPNMRLLYNLCGWEIRLAKARAKGDEELLKKELGRALCWPYLAKEVYSLNEKYLH